MSEPPRIDPAKVEALAIKTFGYMNGAYVSAMIYLGDRLGLYKALAAGPSTSEELAQRAGCHERWIREWLHGQVAAELIDFDGERFSISPEAQLHGYDNSTHALERATRRLAESGLSNCFFHDSDAEPIPGDGSFDAFLVIDALHDMTRPDLAMRAVRAALKPDGIWFIVEINAQEDWRHNLAHPLAPLMYASSVMTCMSSATCRPDGLGLGTLGLSESRLFAMLREAGFTRMARVPGLEHPFNAYYYAQS